MTDAEYKKFRAEMRNLMAEHEELGKIIIEIRKRDPELAELLLVAEAAEKAISNYIKEKDGN